MEACNSKSFIICLYTKTIRAKQAKVLFINFAQREQGGIIKKQLT